MFLSKNYRAELRSKGFYSVYERQGRAFIHVGCYEISGRVTVAKIVDALRYA